MAEKSLEHPGPEAPDITVLESAEVIGASAVSSMVEIEPKMPEVKPAKDASKELWDFAKSFPFVDRK